MAAPTARADRRRAGAPRRRRPWRARPHALAVRWRAWRPAVAVRGLHKRFGDVEAVARDRPRGRAAARSSPCSVRTAPARPRPSRSSRAIQTATKATWPVLGLDPKADRRAHAGACRHRPARARRRAVPHGARGAAAASGLLSETSGPRPRSSIASGSTEKAGSQGPEPVRRPAAAPRPRPGAHRRPGAAVPGRADDRLRPERTARGLGDRPRADRGGSHRAAHDALHGRGAGARRPGGGDRQEAGSSPPGRRTRSGAATRATATVRFLVPEDLADRRAAERRRRRPPAARSTAPPRRAHDRSSRPPCSCTAHHLGRWHTASSSRARGRPSRASRTSTCRSPRRTRRMNGAPPRRDRVQVPADRLLAQSPQRLLHVLHAGDVPRDLRLALPAAMSATLGGSGWLRLDQYFIPGIMTFGVICGLLHQPRHHLRPSGSRAS